MAFKAKSLDIINIKRHKRKGNNSKGDQNKKA